MQEQEGQSSGDDSKDKVESVEAQLPDNTPTPPTTGPAEGELPKLEPQPPDLPGHHKPEIVDPTPVAKYGSVVIQALCIVAVAVVAIYDLRTPGESVGAIVYGALVGVAFGIDPSTFLRGLSK